MSLKNIIDKDIKESMFQKNKNRLIALRAIKAAILLEEKSGSSNNFNENQLLMKFGPQSLAKSIDRSEFTTDVQVPELPPITCWGILH